MKLFYTALFCTCTLLSCIVEAEQQAAQSASVPQKKVDEDTLLLRLSNALVSHPTTREQEEQNALLTLALDSLWDVQQTSTGLWVELLEAGTGDTIQWGDHIEVHYAGHFLDGKVFDSSYDRNQPLKFNLGTMIYGWNEGLEYSTVGSKMRLLLPSRLAYGDKGFIIPPADTLIPPHTPIWFYVESLRKIR